MKVTPAATTSRSNAMAWSGPGESPHTFGPVSCIAPYPTRPTVRSSPIITVDEISRDWVAMASLLWLHRGRVGSSGRPDRDVTPGVLPSHPGDVTGHASHRHGLRFDFCRSE